MRSFGSFVITLGCVLLWGLAGGLNPGSSTAPAKSPAAAWHFDPVAFAPLPVVLVGDDSDDVADETKPVPTLRTLPKWLEGQATTDGRSACVARAGSRSIDRRSCSLVGSVVLLI